MSKIYLLEFIIHSYSSLQVRFSSAVNFFLITDKTSESALGKTLCNPFTRADRRTPRWPRMQAGKRAIVKIVNTSTFIRVNNSIPLIYDRTVRQRQCSAITYEDDKCFSDGQFFPRGALSAVYGLSSICRRRIAFIEYFQQLWRGAE